MSAVELHTGASNARKPRPEDVLANIEARLGRPVDVLGERAQVTPNVDFSEYSVPARIEEALTHNRQRLALLPEQAEAEELAKIAREALAICTPAVVKREVATLVGSFPNAALSNPEIFLSSLVFDLLDKRIPDAVVVLACRRLRRSSRFVPAIADVLGVADAILQSCRAIEAMAVELPATRAALVDAVAKAEATLALVKRDIAEGYRDAGGRILRRRAAYQQAGKQTGTNRDNAGHVPKCPGGQTEDKAEHSFGNLGSYISRVNAVDQSSYGSGRE